MVAAWLLTGLSCELSATESWGTSLFPVKRHDFGRVAIGANASFRFEFENGYLEDIRVIGVSSSCGCTSVTVTKNLLKSAEKAAVVAKLNTSGQHTHEKSATLTVHLETVVDGHAIQDTVQLFVTSYIRPDVILTPGIVEFGSIPEGKPVTRTVLLEYSGREDWALTRIERTNDFIHARAEQVRNEHGEITYRITVTLKDNAPVGYVKDTLRLATNESRPGRRDPVEIVLPVQGVVTAPIQVKPSPFMAGLVPVGKSVAKSIVVRGEMPFRILEVRSTDSRFQFTHAEQKSNIQIVSVLFTPAGTGTNRPVDLYEKIRIRTDLPDQEYVVLNALAHIVPAHPGPEAREEAVPSGMIATTASEPDTPIIEPELSVSDSGFEAAEPGFEPAEEPSIETVEEPLQAESSSVSGARFGKPGRRAPLSSGKSALTPRSL